MNDYSEAEGFAYSRGYKDAVDAILGYLDLYGGQEMLNLKASIKYLMAKGVDYDYPMDEGDPI